MKLIQIPWTGVDNLNFDLLSNYNTIQIANSHSNSILVAEHAIALMFDVSKKLSYHDRLMRNGNWNRLAKNKINEVSPFSKLISKSTIGILGFGAIGKSIYSLLSGFNVKFKLFNRSGKSTQINNDSKVFPINNFINEIGDLDILFITIPLTDETTNLVNKEVFSKLNSNCILINVSRGEVVNEHDLFNALFEKQILGAGIDTWYNYPTAQQENVFPSAKFDFHSLNNIVLSPHRAGYIDSGFLHLDDAIENLNRLKEGRELINIISTKNKY